MYIIGIDPDAKESGFALRSTDQKNIHSLECLDFWNLIEELTRLKNDTHIVLLESGWLNDSNWHTKAGDNSKYAAAKGRSVGMNHQTGILIEQFLKYNNIPYRLIRPAAKNWWKENAPLFAKVTGWTKRTNKETRDAGMLVFSFIR